MLKERHTPREIIIPDEEAAIRKLKQLGREDMLDTVEVISKERLRHKPSLIKQLGLRRERRVKFYAIPDYAPKRIERDPKH